MSHGHFSKLLFEFLCSATFINKFNTYCYELCTSSEQQYSLQEDNVFAIYYLNLASNFDVVVGCWVFLDLKRA